MRGWLMMLGGLIVWTIHFVGVYTIASIADVADQAGGAAERAAVVLLTIVCLGVAGLIFRRALQCLKTARDDDMAGFMSFLAAAGAGVSLIAILWQAAPVLFTG